VDRGFPWIGAFPGSAFPLDRRFPWIGFPLDLRFPWIGVSPGSGRRHGRDWPDPAPAWADWSKPGAAWSGRFPLRGSGRRSPLRFTLAFLRSFTLVISHGSHWPPPGPLPALPRVASSRSFPAVHTGLPQADSSGSFPAVHTGLPPVVSPWSFPAVHTGLPPVVHPVRFPRFTLATPQVASSGSFPAVHSGPPRPFPAIPHVTSLRFPGSVPPGHVLVAPGRTPGLAGINPFHRLGFEDNIFEKDNVNSK